MARIRSLKPGHCTSPTTAQLSIPARYFEVLLWTEADDEGRFHNSAKKLAGNLYPNDENVTSAKVSKWLAEVVKVGRVCLYEVDGAKYGHVVKFKEHQRPQHATPSRIPPCPIHTDSGGGQDSDPSGSGDPHENDTKNSGLELGVGGLELGDGSSSSVSEEPRLRLVDDDEEDFASILAGRWADERDDLEHPRRWQRTVEDDLRSAYATVAGAWTGTQAELADEVERCERKSPESLNRRPVDRHECELCERGWVETPAGVVRCGNDDAARAAVGGKG